MTVGGVIGGYWSTGSDRWASKPVMMTATDSTVAKIGRSMKKCASTAAPGAKKRQHAQTRPRCESSPGGVGFRLLGVDDGLFQFHLCGQGAQEDPFLGGDDGAALAFGGQDDAPAVGFQRSQFDGPSFHGVFGG